MDWWNRILIEAACTTYDVRVGVEQQVRASYIRLNMTLFVHAA